MTITIDIDTINANQRVKLIDQLWEKFDVNDFSIPTDHLSLIKKRIADDPATNNQGISWNDLKRKIKERHHD
jgi:hypothetical protein